MILRASDRALADHLARINLRCEQLWADLDTVQAQISECVAIPDHRPVTGPWIDRGRYAELTTREREILAELDRIDD